MKPLVLAVALLASACSGLREPDARTYARACRLVLAQQHTSADTARILTSWAPRTDFIGGAKCALFIAEDSQYPRAVLKAQEGK